MQRSLPGGILLRNGLFGEHGSIDQDASVFVDDVTENVDVYSFVPAAEGLLDKDLLFLPGQDDEVCFAEEHFFPLYRSLRALGHPDLDARILGMDQGFSGVGMESLVETAAGWIVHRNPGR